MNNFDDYLKSIVLSYINEDETDTSPETVPTPESVQTPETVEFDMEGYVKNFMSNLNIKELKK